MKNFRDLDVWERSHKLTISIYSMTKKFPRDEAYGLTSQMRRCASSVPSNIAEGCGRGSDSDFARFVQIAMGSASELEYQLLLARDLGYLDPHTHDHCEVEATGIKRMLAGLLSRLRKTG